MNHFCPLPHKHPVMNTPAIWHPSDHCPRSGYSVVLFRRRFHLKRAVKALRVWISASQRFEFLVDGQLVARGPSRSDPTRWGVASVTLPVLKAGQHVCAARVTHFGKCGGQGQMGGEGFFILSVADGRSELEDVLDTGEQWCCWHDVSRRPATRRVGGGKPSHCVVGCGDRVDGRLAPWGWEQVRFDDGGWLPARVVCRAAGDVWGNVPLGHVLRPDPLPAMEETRERFRRVAEVSGLSASQAGDWIAGKGVATVPAQASARLLLDMGELVNAYPVLVVSGGRNARIRLVSAEAPFDDADGAKSNRNETVGKKIWGQSDELVLDGGSARTYSTLWLRSFRYLEVLVRTGSTPVKLADIQALTTGFPMRERARFRATGPNTGRFGVMWQVGWRTARLCAHETFFDCPHYEQMQFPGDSRVQAVFHYLVANEDRLARKAMDDFHASRLPDGLTLCKYPSQHVQVLPTFSLHWIGMLDDFRVYRGDREFLHRYMNGARGVLAWFENRIRRDGLLGWIDYAPFVDWATGFEAGNAPQDEEGGSAILTLLFAEACQWMARLERACGQPALAAQWQKRSHALTRATLRVCWDKQRGLIADTARKRTFSLHAQVQAVLAGAWPLSRARAVLQRGMRDGSITQPGTFYYQYYVIQALKRAGLREAFFDRLLLWEQCLEGTGLTTWPESAGTKTRSDCHAWSVTPSIEFLQTVLGIEPDPQVAGFGGVVLTPDLGPLTQARGAVRIPRGVVSVELQREDRNRMVANVRSPVPVVVAGTAHRLAPGAHRLVMGRG